MNTYMRIRRPAVLLGSVLLSSSLAFGQATSNPAAPAAPEADEETIVLSPFEVNADTDSGYVATETLAGTRIRTDLRDVGGAISVVTKEFLNDIGATDNSTLLQYTPNAEVAGTRGTYTGLGDGTSLDESATLRAPGGAQRVRGLASADNTRDFFVTDIPWDAYNVDRIDIQRGPNSILFGLGSPAGIVNAQTRNAGFTTGGEVQGRIGSYGSWRANLDYNQVIVDDVLSVRVSALEDREKFRQDQAFENDRRFYGALRWDPTLFSNNGARTSIKLKYETGEIDANRPRIVPPSDQLSAWFRPRVAPGQPLTADNPFNGMGKEAMNNPYDPWRTDSVATPGVNNSVTAAERRGQIQSATVNYQPYLTAPPNQQQPFWLIDGGTNQLFRAWGGFINNGGRNTTGGFTGISAGIPNKRTADQFYGVKGLADAAKAANLPNSQYGIYKDQSLIDPSIFDFYNTLIDGPNKEEWENWDAYNIDLSQTMFDDRLGFNYVYDRQKYDRGNNALFNNTPGITLDILQNMQDYYLTVNDTNPDAPLSVVTNPNFGRPYVISNAGGGGSTYVSERESHRASVFYELRAADVSNSNFLQKLLGKQRFNGVFSSEEYFTENRSWQNLANSQEWAGYWNGNAGNTSPIFDRAPHAYIYLGSSIASLNTPAGANIPGVDSLIDVPDARIYVMDSTWTGPSALENPAFFGQTWTVPTNMQRVFNGTLQGDGTRTLAQNSNPANYLGWGSHFQNNLIRYNEGEDLSLLRRSQLSLRKTESYAFSWQGYLWNEAIIPTVGWRRDEVTSRAVSAREVGSNRNSLDLSAASYRLPDGPNVAANQFYTNQSDNSTSYGGVIHINRFFGDDDRLPLNVSFSYSKSDNFQVTDARRDIYGNSIPNPRGETEDWGVTLATKDGKYSLRAIKYETKLFGANSGLSDAGGIGRTIVQGLRFRNVHLYDLGGYDWATREQSQSRNSWSNQFVHPNGNTGGAQDITPAEGRRREDSAINAWNEIQAWLAPQGFFDAWGFTPATQAALTDRSTYEASIPADMKDAEGRPLPLSSGAAQYLPDPNTIYAYGSGTPQGFTVTADTVSKGYEFELTANPLPNWRVSFNASKQEATRLNVGGPVLDEFVAFLDEKFTNPDAHSSPTEVTANGIGDQSWAALMPQFGNFSLNLYANVYGPWRANYVAMKLQEGAAAPEVRKWRFNFITNYTFQEGFLKNVGVGGSYRWQDKVTIGYPTLAGGIPDFTQPYFGPSEDSIDLWASYGRRLSEKIDWRIQLNIRNAFASDGLIPISVQPDGQTWASVRVKPNQEWFLTNTFSF